MSATLGKRKRGEAKGADEELTGATDLQALLQRHFEARFKPLETGSVRRKADSDEDEDEDDLDGYDDDDTVTDSSEDEWDGISDDEDGGMLQICSIGGVVTWGANRKQHPCPPRNQCRPISRL